MVEASMRPRVFPAEDTNQANRHCIFHTRFNEAAGIPRGRLRQPGRRRRRDGRFNEAAGIPRGRRATPPPAPPKPRRFNEAAGIPRGRRATPTPPRRWPDASMRPRVLPAEDQRVGIDQSSNMQLQ